MHTPSGRFSIMFVVFAALFLYGLYSTARAVLLQPISLDYGVSYTGSGLMFLIAFVSVLVTNLAAGRILTRFGMRVFYVASLIGVAALLLWQAATADYIFFLLTTILLTMFTSGQNLGGNSLVATAFAGDGGAKLNMMHIFYGLGSLMAPFVIAVLGDTTAEGRAWLPAGLSALVPPDGLGWREIFRWLAVSFCVVLLWWPFYRIRMRDSSPSGSGSGFRRALGNRLLVKITLANLFAGGYEVAISSWLVYTLVRAVGIAPETAALAIAAFFFGLAFGRAAGSWLARRGWLHGLLLPLAVVQAVIAVLALIFLEDLPWLFALAGLTSSIYFPTFFYMVAERCHVPAAGAVYLTGAGLGVALIPFLVGVLGDVISIRWGLIAAVFCALALIPSIIAIERHREVAQ